MATAEKLLRGHAAEGLPVRVKSKLMDLPHPVWKRLVYPLWRRWYRWFMDSASWRYGSYEPGDRVRWRGVTLICCTGHYCGHAADHPWDPGLHWPAWKANAMWEPATRRDRILLAVVGDPRRSAAPVVRGDH